MAKGEVITGDGGVQIEQFWKDNGNKALTIAAVVGAGAGALLLVKLYFDRRRRKKVEEDLAAINADMFVEEARELGEDHGADEVSIVAAALAQTVEEATLADALYAVSTIAGESKRMRK